MSMRIGFGYDIHAIKKFSSEYPSAERTITLGGIAIPSEYQMIAHSDGDVLVHALMDALLGALALGDIGEHFPNHDPQYAGISSIILLEKVWSFITKAGYRLNNTDLTVIAEVPFLSAYYGAMRAALAKCIHCDISQVSIKATTAEQLGALGRREGMAVHAVVLLEKIDNGNI